MAAGPPSGGLYLNPPSSGGLCDGVTTIPSARPPEAAAPRCRPGSRETATGSGCSRPGCRQHLHVVGDEHLERGGEGGLGQRVRVAADEQRAGDPGAGAVVADGLGGRGDVVVVERQPEGRAAVARRAEGDLLPGLGRVRVLRVVGGHQGGDVDEVGLARWLSGPIACFHCHLPVGRPAARLARRRPVHSVPRIGRVRHHPAGMPRPAGRRAGLCVYPGVDSRFPGIPSVWPPSMTMV